MPTNYTAIANGAAANASTFNSPLQELDNAIEAVKDGSTALSAPDVTSFANAQHNHQDAAGGGKLTEDAINSGSAGSGAALVADGSGGAEWGKGKTGARVTHSGSQSINTATATTLAFDTEIYDDGWHDTVTNNSRLTAPRTGRYLIMATVQMASTSSDVELRLLLNGATIIAKAVERDDAAGVPVVQVQTIYELTAGQYVEAVVYHTHGSAINATVGSAYAPLLIIQNVD